MFGWLKRKAKPTVSDPAPAPAATAPAATTAASSASAGTPPPPATPAMRLTETGPAPGTAPAAASVGLAQPKTRKPAPDFKELPPKVGIAAMEIGPKVRRRAKVTRVHPDGHYLVALIKSTGQGYAYTRQPDGTFRRAGYAGGSAPRLVIGME
jgi:hypothetical protein